MREVVTSGIICLQDDLGLEYYLCRLDFVEREDETFHYRFTPDYSVMDLLPTTLFQGIPGLDLGLRQKEYIRENITPVFISERSPASNREDLWQLLNEQGMEYLNPLEWLMRTNTHYGGDHLYVKRLEPQTYKQAIAFESMDTKVHRSVHLMNSILDALCRGDSIDMGRYLIDDSNRQQYYILLKALYQKEKSYLDAQRAKGIRRAAEKKMYAGGQPIPIDDTKLNEVMSEYQAGLITQQQASKKLGVSRATFYRRLKAFKDR